MASGIERYRGGASNLPEVATAGLGKVIVVGSTVATPIAIGGAGILAWHALGIPDGTTPGFIHHIPVVGNAINSGLVDAGSFLHGVEHIPVAGPALTVGLAAGAGYVAYKKIGKPVQNAAKRVVKRHGLG